MLSERILYLTALLQCLLLVGIASEKDLCHESGDVGWYICPLVPRGDSMNFYNKAECEKVCLEEQKIKESAVTTSASVFKTSLSTKITATSRPAVKTTPTTRPHICGDFAKEIVVFASFAVLIKVRVSAEESSVGEDLVQSTA